MLGPGAAEGDQRVAGRIVPPAQRDRADRLGHALVGDFEEAGEDRLGAGIERSHPRAQIVESLPRRRRVQGDLEAVRVETAEDQVDVGQRQRAARAVAGGAGPGAGALRPHLELNAVEAADRAAAGGHALDGEGGRDEVGVPHLVLEEVFEVAIPAGDVGAGAAHVEGDHPREAGPPAGAGGADDPARGSGEEAVLGAEGLRPHQPAGAGHHMEGAGSERAGDAGQIALQDRRQIGVHHRRLRPREELDQGRQLRGERDVAETGLAQQPPHFLLVAGDCGRRASSATAAASIPSSSRRRAASRTAPASSGISTEPSAASRSGTSTASR